jgi:F-type H+-transporting ATPase subunit delta
MTSSAVVTRYAGALVDVVTAETSGVRPQQTIEELRAFDTALRDSHELRTVMLSPAVPPSRKRAVIARIAGQLGFSRVTRNFLYVLTDRRRLDALTEITEQFEILLDERLGFVRAGVVSAAPLDQGQQEALAERLARIAGKQVRVKYGVDESLIGGVTARVGSTVYDGSVRGRLQALERRLARE